MKKEGKLFVHIFSWPQDGVLSVPALTSSIGKIYLMNNPGKALDYTMEDGKIQVSLLEGAPDEINSVVVVEVAGLPEAAVK
jgi:alpha-L-fucosidase